MKLTPENIDDVIRSGRHHDWTPEEYKTLAEFAIINGLNWKFEFMGVTHSIKKEYGNK